MKTLTFSAATWISGAVSEDAGHDYTKQKTQGKAGWAGCELTEYLKIPQVILNFRHSSFMIARAFKIS